MHYHGKLVREHLPFAACIPCKLLSALGAVSLSYVGEERLAKFANISDITGTNFYSVKIILLTSDVAGMLEALLGLYQEQDYRCNGTPHPC